MNNRTVKESSMEDITNKMLGTSDSENAITVSDMFGDPNEDSFQIIGEENGEALNEQLNGISERYDHTSPIIDVIRAIGGENIEKNGVPVYYISIDTDYKNDKIMGDPNNKTATGLFRSIKLYSDTDSLPTFTNMKTSFDFQNYLNDFLMYAHKDKFQEKTMFQIEKFKETNMYWNKCDNGYIPKPGDIIIIDNEFLVAFELTDVDDDSYMHLGKRDYWTLELQHWTKQNVNYTLVEKDMSAIGLDFVIKGHTTNNKTISNSIIEANSKLDDDDRNVNKNIKDGDNAFEKTFGEWG